MGDLSLPPALARDARFRAFAKLTERLDDIDLSPLLVYLIGGVDASALPFLADQFSVMGEDGWNLAESDEAKRALIKGAIELHRYKGTPWAVRDVIRRLGFGEVELIESIARVSYDGKHRYNGWMVHGDPGLWAAYRIILLDRAVTNDQAVLLRTTLAAFAPARCVLASLEYRSVPVRYNGAAHYDAQFNHGSS
ncbi:phage tail protein I [Burkholderia glumae]|uniref:phage tail protein I n=1 Tax=Burkholderia glumae TaxID=337 RepID=UPI0003A8C073|nr:phage tail protein I [Burkholderia glumae]MCM2494534.1 phage tail protein I [Burkholderia glumae]MCM2545443.1 phage tail protein I [Burkholderia glumae]